MISNKIRELKNQKNVLKDTTIKCNYTTDLVKVLNWFDPEEKTLHVAT